MKSELQVLIAEAQKENLIIEIYKDVSLLDWILSIKSQAGIFTVKAKYPGLRFNGFECSMSPLEAASEGVKQRLTWPFRNEGQGGGFYDLSLRNKNGFYNLKEQRNLSPKEIVGLIINPANYRRY